MAINLENNASIVRISPEMTEAYLTVCAPGEGESYTEGDLRDILEKHGVVYGIKREVLTDILEKKQYFTECLVAEGNHAVDGRDGRFEFLFNTEVDNKPKVLKDGSVDYTSMAKLEIVEEGAEIVRYYPAKPGLDGIDVRGEIIKCRPGKDLPQIKGKGFTVSEDKTRYIANTCGKVEYNNDRLVVSNTLTIEGDVTRVTGDIDFKGDVLVRGNVVTGMMVHAGGNITVDGHVEAATLSAGGNVVLKNGMQGGGKGEINAGGEVSGKFFEQATIYAKGNINANALMNCNIISEGMIIVSGRMGVLVGGSASAVEGIQATIVGNMSEVKMHINLGVDYTVYGKLSELEEKIKKVREDIAKLNLAMEQISAVIEKAPNADLSQKKIEILRTKISKDAQLTGFTEEVNAISTLIDKSVNARLVVSKSIYRGTRITINGVTKNIESENYNLTYCKRGADIISYPNI